MFLYSKNTETAIQGPSFNELYGFKQFRAARSREASERQSAPEKNLAVLSRAKK